MTSGLHSIPLNLTNASLSSDGRQLETGLNPASCLSILHQPDSLTYPSITPTGIAFLDKALEQIKLFCAFPKKFLKKLQKLNSKRGKRKQRIEAITKVCRVILQYVELWTLKIGSFCEKGNFVSLCDQKYIAKEAGLAVIRVRRALRDLRLAGYLKTTQNWIKKADGSYKGLVSVKQLSTSFFSDLGLDYKKLVKLQDWKRKRVEKKLADEQKKSGSSFLGGLLKPFTRKKKHLPLNVDDAKANLLVQKRKAFAAEVLRLHKLHPDISLDVIKVRLAPMLE